MTRSTERTSMLVLLVLLLAVFALALAGCRTPAEDGSGDASGDEPATEAPAADDSPDGTYTGEFGATVELEDGGTVDAMVPLTIEIAEDGSLTGSWDHSAEIPDPEIDSAQTSATFTGALEGDAVTAVGKGTITFAGPAGSLTDSFGVTLDGTLEFGTIIGTVEFYGESEEFVVEKQ
jgi:hypothetical protein